MLAYPDRMSSVRNPRGPQPAAVYWRRRILALVGLIAVIVCIVLIVSALANGGGGANPTPTPTGTSTTGTDVEPDPDADEGDPCNPAVIRVVAVTDANSYPAGVTPLISMSITNTGSVACTLDVGTTEQRYDIVSGSDPIWNSADCQTDPTSLEQVIEANETLTTTPFPWDRTRSSPTTCTGERPQVTGNGATYRLSVRLGDIESASDLPFVLQ